MFRNILAAIVLAASALFGVIAWAQDKRDVIIIAGKTAEVFEWKEGESYDVRFINPDGSGSWRVLISPKHGSWYVGFPTYLDDKNCAQELQIVKMVTDHAGYRSSSYSVTSCRYNKVGGNRLGDFSSSAGTYITQKIAAPNAACTPEAYLGIWQRPGSGKQNAQVQLVFSKDGNEGAAQARGFARAPYSENEQVLSRIYPGDAGCRYKAKCGTVLSASPSCTIVVDPARGTLTVEGGGKTFISDVAWTRAAAAPAAATCSARDIDGDWHRSDGALVPIVGIDAGFRDGGNALMFNHPDNWPKGTHKFLRVFRQGGPDSCKMPAVCINYDINRSTGQTFKRERDCTLTVDPKRQTLSESGSTLSYSRTPRNAVGSQTPRSITTPPVEAPASLPATSAQDLAEIATRERLNAEQAAFAAKQLAENEAAKAAFAKATAEREAAIARQQAEHRAAVAAVEAERVRREKEHAAAMAKWRADVDACKRSDVSRCAPQP